MVLVTKTSWYVAGVPAASLFDSDMPWEMVHALMRNSIILVFNRQLPFRWLQARFTDMDRRLLYIRILNGTYL